MPDKKFGVLIVDPMDLLLHAPVLEREEGIVEDQRDRTMVLILLGADPLMRAVIERIVQTGCLSRMCAGIEYQTIMSGSSLQHPTNALYPGIIKLEDAVPIDWDSIEVLLVPPYSPKVVGGTKHATVIKAVLESSFGKDTKILMIPANNFSSSAATIYQLITGELSRSVSNVSVLHHGWAEFAPLLTLSDRGLAGHTGIKQIISDCCSVDGNGTSEGNYPAYMLETYDTDRHKCDVAFLRRVTGDDSIHSVYCPLTCSYAEMGGAVKTILEAFGDDVTVVFSHHNANVIATLRDKNKGRKNVAFVKTDPATFAMEGQFSEPDLLFIPDVDGLYPMSLAEPSASKADCVGNPSIFGIVSKMLPKKVVVHVHNGGAADKNSFRVMEPIIGICDYAMQGAEIGPSFCHLFSATRDKRL